MPTSLQHALHFQHSWQFFDSNVPF
jgi:hypothetical protein